MGIVIVGDIEGTVNDKNNNYENETDDENYKLNNEDIYDKILKSMTKYNLQYDKFNHNIIIKETFENINTKQDITYTASSPIPIPYSNKNK